jgi:hypothetical protein
MTAVPPTVTVLGPITTADTVVGAPLTIVGKAAVLTGSCVGPMATEGKTSFGRGLLVGVAKITGLASVCVTLPTTGFRVCGVGTSGAETAGAVVAGLSPGFEGAGGLWSGLAGIEGAIPAVLALVAGPGTMESSTRLGPASGDGVGDGGLAVGWTCAIGPASFVVGPGLTVVGSAGDGGGGGGEAVVCSFPPSSVCSPAPPPEPVVLLVSHKNDAVSHTCAARTRG